ncbi:MAG TPA: DsbA family oxidoreductase [Micropepsaceae bacterium]|nr:DsbA family oxidoreductase [Micropepsaceae bacterium]
MNEELEGQVCSVDGCVPADVPAAAAVNAAPLEELNIVSDVICPWCYVGKRRLEKALGILGQPRLRITWRPFELNPQMPKEGMDRAAYRMRKFGSLERSQTMDAQLTAVAAAEGLTFRYDLIHRTPNTFDAHRLIWLGARRGIQDAVAETLFRGYFGEGRDVGDRNVLADLAQEAGIERSEALDFLSSEQGAAEVKAEELVATGAGISGVPSFILKGRLLFSGAQPSDAIARVLSQMLSAPATA